MGFQQNDYRYLSVFAIAFNDVFPSTRNGFASCPRHTQFECVSSSKTLNFSYHFISFICALAMSSVCSVVPLLHRCSLHHNRLRTYQRKVFHPAHHTVPIHIPYPMSALSSSRFASTGSLSIRVAILARHSSV